MSKDEAVALARWLLIGLGMSFGLFGLAPAPIERTWLFSTLYGAPLGVALWLSYGQLGPRSRLALVALVLAYMMYILVGLVDKVFRALDRL